MAFALIFLFLFASRQKEKQEKFYSNYKSKTFAFASIFLHQRKKKIKKDHKKNSGNYCRSFIVTNPFIKLRVY